MKYLFLIFIISLLASIDSSAQELNPGDGVRISFLDITDVISGDYFVQPDGVIHMPFIGVVSVNNKDFKDIKNDILKWLGQTQQISIDPKRSSEHFLYSHWQIFTAGRTAWTYYIE